MLTGRPVITIKVSRSGISDGAISGSSSETGRECHRARKTRRLEKRDSFATDEGQVEVTGARAGCIERRTVLPSPPVTALPRRTTAVPAGISWRMVRQNCSKRSALPSERRDGSRCDSFSCR
jgi:hypothetical protein